MHWISKEKNPTLRERKEACHRKLENQGTGLQQSLEEKNPPQRAAATENSDPVDSQRKEPDSATKKGTVPKKTEDRSGLVRQRKEGKH